MPLCNTLSEHGVLSIPIDPPDPEQHDRAPGALKKGRPLPHPGTMYGLTYSCGSNAENPARNDGVPASAASSQGPRVAIVLPAGRGRRARRARRSTRGARLPGRNAPELRNPGHRDMCCSLPESPRCSTPCASHGRLRRSGTPFRPPRGRWSPIVPLLIAFYNYFLSVEGHDIVDKKMCHNIVDNAL